MFGTTSSPTPYPSIRSWWTTRPGPKRGRRGARLVALEAAEGVQCGVDQGAEVDPEAGVEDGDSNPRAVDQETGSRKTKTEG
jgi:hypothetical protein